MSQSIDLKRVVLIENLYPRNEINWLTVHQYVESLKTGAEFPPIIVVAREEGFVIVDGAHRVEAYRKFGESRIQAKIKRRWSDAKIFSTSVKINASHGRRLSPQERIRSAQKLLTEFKFNKNQVQKILDMPISSIIRLIDQRVEGIKAVGVTALVTKKAPLSNTDLSGVSPDTIESIQKSLSSNSQISIFKQVLIILENDVLDRDDSKLMAVVDKIGKEIKKLKVKA